MIRFLILTALFLTSCTQKKGGFRVGATPIPQAEMLEFVKPLLKDEGIDLSVVVISDYNILNRALQDKEIDANFFQHIPFLESQIKEFHYKIQSVGKIEIEPMGIYSDKYGSIEDLPNGAQIAIPNDPTNEARALFLLQDHELIRLNSSSFNATIKSITYNPKNLKFIEISAATLPRTLKDVAAAAINANYALQAGLNPEKDALLIESQDSRYANVLVVRDEDADAPQVKALVKAMTSEKMKAFIEEKYKGAVLPAF